MAIVRFRVEKQGSRWQPIDGTQIVRTSLVNKDGSGYATETEAREALGKYIDWKGRRGIFPTTIADRPETRGLSDNEDLLDQFVQMAAESAEDSGDIKDTKVAEATPEVIEIAKRFDQAVWEALNEVVRVTPGSDFSAEDLWFAEGPYLILMTLRGEGVGIWDGSWDQFYNKDQISSISKFLKKRLGKFASDSGSGELEEAFQDAAFETTEGFEPAPSHLL